MADDFWDSQPTLSRRQEAMHVPTPAEIKAAYDDWWKRHPTLSKWSDRINEPLAKKGPAMQKAEAQFAEEHPLIGNAARSGTDLLYSQTAPLNLGLTAAEGAGLAARAAGLTRSSRALDLTQRGTSAAFTAQGAANLAGGLSEGDYGKAVGGGLQMIPGVMGARKLESPQFGTMPVDKPKIRIPDSLPLPEQYKPPSLGRKGQRLELPPAPEPAPVGSSLVSDSPLIERPRVHVFEPTRAARPTGFIIREDGNTVPRSAPNAAATAAYGSASGAGTEPSGNVLNPRGLDTGELREQNRLANTTYGPGAQGGTVVATDARGNVNRERVDNGIMDARTVGPYDEPNGVPPVSGDPRFGFQEQSNGPLPYPLNVVPNSVRPRAVQRETIQNVPSVYQDVPTPTTGPAKTVDLTPAVEEPTRPVSDVVSSVPNPEMQPRRPSAREAIKKQRFPMYGESSDILKDKPKGVIVTPETAAGKGRGKGQVGGNNQPPGSGNTNAAPVKQPYTGPIPLDASPQQAILDWANKLKASIFKGQMKERAFSDLPQGMEAVHEYQKGVRNDRTKEVEKLMDELHSSEVGAGMLKEDQKKANYLRQYWEQDPETVSAAISNYIAKNPKFAKTSKLPDYMTGMSLKEPLTPKYQNLNEIVGARTRESARAFANKDLRDWLVETKQLRPGGIISDNPSSWDVIGPNKKEIQKLIKNVMDESQSGLVHGVADASSLSKNISLAGGIPGTKYNMHAYNIARSDAKLSGYWKSLKELLSDPTGRHAEELLTEMSRTRSKDLGDLADRGYVANIISDKTKDLGFLGKTGKAVTSSFEAPLFERSLPALSQKRTLEVLDTLISKGVPREKALREAAKIGNDFFGGVNESAVGLKAKNLRSATANDIARIGFLAPEWLESRVNLAAKDYKAIAKFVTGQTLSEAEKIYAKSGARGAALSGGILAGKTALGLMNNKPGDVLNVPIGEDAQGKSRQLAFGTSDEGARVPIQAAVKTYQGDPAALVDLLIKNKLSIPAQSAINVVRGQDDFGNPLKGKDKYGRDISMGSAITNYLRTLTKPVQYQLVQGLLKYAAGDASLEEALVTGAELPVAYHTKEKEKPGSIGAPRFRLQSR